MLLPLRSAHALLSPLSKEIMLTIFAVQALPLFLDRLANPVTAVLVSVVVVLIFGKLQPLLVL